MNISAYNILGSSMLSEKNTFNITTDLFYIGTGIGLSCGVLTSIILAHYLYYKRQIRLHNAQVVFEEQTHINETHIHELIKSNNDLSA
jgi:predicted small secreted protein